MGTSILKEKAESRELISSHLDEDGFCRYADLPGTQLRTARCVEFKDKAVQARAAKLLRDMDVAGLIVIGGDGSFQGARALCEQGIPCIGIPGTIDNDLGLHRNDAGL